MINPERVTELFVSLLFNDDEATDPHVPVEGITLNIGLYPQRLEQAKPEIRDMLEELPSQFKKSGGGGWTFLNMCMDKDGDPWTGSHKVMQELMMMGIAAGYMEYALPKPRWETLPGGMPYVIYHDDRH